MDFITLWKTISIGITAAFGALGILTETKDKATGKTTKYGYLTLAGIIISAAIGMVAQYKEQSDQERTRTEISNQTLKIAKSTEVAVADIKRVITDIGKPRLSITFGIKCKDELRLFCDEVKATKGPLDYPEVDRIWSKWPSIRNIHNPQNTQSLGLLFVKDKADVERLSRGLSQPDLGYFSVADRYRFRQRQYHNTVLLSSLGEDVFITILALDVNVQFNDRKIVSFNDMENSYLIINGNDLDKMIPLNLAIGSSNGNKASFDLGKNCEERRFSATGLVSYICKVVNESQVLPYPELP